MLVHYDAFFVGPHLNVKDGLFVVFFHCGSVSLNPNTGLNAVENVFHDTGYSFIFLYIPAINDSLRIDYNFLVHLVKLSS